MIEKGWENVGMTWRPFATMLERADTLEAAGLNWAGLRSNQPVFGLRRFLAAAGDGGMPSSCIRSAAQR